MSEEKIPTKMKRLVVTAPGADVKSCKIEVQEVPVPTPTSSQVLIKVVASAINPSDYGTWFRCKPEQCPLPMGNEGCGVVVATGGGLISSINCPVGTKVGFVGLPSDMPIEDAASFFVNPYTAIGILDTVKSEGSKALVHTAAASQLGQMIVKLAPTEGIEVINVVRREEQAELLKNLGAKHIVVTSGDDDSWKETLQSKIMELGASVAFDAVAGKMTGDLLDLLPKKGSVYVYGGLAGRVENIDPMALIYHRKKVKGFLVKNWIQNGGMMAMLPRMMSAGSKVNKGLKDGGWSSSQFKDTTLENAHDDIVKLLDSKATGQKLRVRLDS